MRSHAEYRRAMELIAQGYNDCQVGRMLGISRGTVRDWRHGKSAKHCIDPRELCPRCGQPGHDPADLAHASYAYLLGMYLGDGVISRLGRTRPDPNSWCKVVVVYSNQLPCLFPQHGPGKKHLRPI
jgi:Homeodomain-like domain